MRWFAVALFLGVAMVAALSSSQPVAAKSPQFSVTITASPPAYSGACPAIIKYSGEIDGDAGDTLSYQIARIVGGVPSLTPWVSATIPATGKLLVPDSITVTAAQAGVETETLRVTPGHTEATVKVTVTCLGPNAGPSNNPNPNASPSIKPSSNPAVLLLKPGISSVTAPSPAPSPKNSSLTQGMYAPALQKLPAPTNLTSRNSKDACTAHGGSAESFACYLALPAGKLVLDWDYPFANKIDGFNVYRADSAPSGPTTIHILGAAKPVMTQGDPSLHFEVLEPVRAGACFAVTAYHGSDESDRSVRYCLVQGGVAKIVSLNPDRVGTMVEDWYYYVPTEVWKQSNEKPFVRDLLSITVGYTHVASTWSDNAHTQVSTWTNSLYRGYVHFNTGALNAATIAQAKLRLHAKAGGETCLANWGAADHLWNPGDRLTISGSWLGGSTVMGPDLSLDVTPIVQSWASSPGTNTGFALHPAQAEVIYQMIILSSTCFTEFPSASLDVTYY